MVFAYTFTLNLIKTKITGYERNTFKSVFGHR